MKLASRRTSRWAITLISVAAAASVATSEQGGAEQARERRTPGKWERHYYVRVAEFKKENDAARNIVMVGSSHVEGFKADELLPGRRVVNRGISADRIGIDDRGVLHRLDSSVFDCNPGFIILQNGANDLGELWRNGTPSVDQVETCYREVVKRIRTRCPDAPLLIVGLFPTRDKYADLVPFITEFNKRLTKVAADFDCPLMDVYTPFADSEGLLREELSRDGLHFNEAGYRLWAEMIEAALSSADGEAEKR